MAAHQKEQKMAYKLKHQHQPKLPFKSDVTIFDVFNVLEGAHECVAPNYKVEGILEFLDLKSIMHLSWTCKDLKLTVLDSNIMSYPMHVVTKQETIRNIVYLRRQRAKEDLKKTKYKVGKSAHLQLIHAKRFSTREKFRQLKQEIAAKWRARFGRTLLFDFLIGTEFGGIRELEADSDSD
jgi:hypothetical protein